MCVGEGAVGNMVGAEGDEPGQVHASVPQSQHATFPGQTSLDLGLQHTAPAEHAAHCPGSGVSHDRGPESTCHPCGAGWAFRALLR